MKGRGFPYIRMFKGRRILQGVGWVDLGAPTFVDPLPEIFVDVVCSVLRSVWRSILTCIVHFRSEEFFRCVEEEVVVCVKEGAVVFLHQ